MRPFGSPLAGELSAKPTEGGHPRWGSSRMRAAGTAAPTQTLQLSRRGGLWPPAVQQPHPAIGNPLGAYYPVVTAVVDGRGPAHGTRGWRAAGFSIIAAPEMPNCSPDGSPGVRGHQPPEIFGAFPSLERHPPEA